MEEAALKGALWTLAAVVSLTTAACSKAPPRAQSDLRLRSVEPPPQHTSSAPLPPLPAPATSPEPAEDLGAMPCRRIAWSNACEPREPPGERIEDLAAWHSQRKLPVPPEDPTNICYAFKAGPAAEEALRCTRMTQPSEGRAGTAQFVFRVVLHQTVSVVRKGRLETVLDVPHYVDVFDKESPVTEGPLFALVVELASDGKSVTFREPAPGACELAKSMIKRELGDESRAIAWARFDEKLLAKICSSVGTYVWSGGSFRRAEAGASASGP